MNSRACSKYGCDLLHGIDEQLDVALGGNVLDGSDDVVKQNSSTQKMMSANALGNLNKSIE